MENLCQQVNLRIIHDWGKTKKVFDQLTLLESKVNLEEYGASDHYDLKSLGTISKHRPSNNWYRLSGPAINNTMPWLRSALDLMKELEPDDGAISKLVGNGAEHTDLPQLKSAVNYIFDNSDKSAYTIVKGAECDITYPSKINTAWILNTQAPHQIVNNGTRWTLSIHFGADFDVVNDWFNCNNNLVFGS